MKKLFIGILALFGAFSVYFLKGPLVFAEEDILSDVTVSRQSDSDQYIIAFDPSDQKYYIKKQDGDFIKRYLIEADSEIEDGYIITSQYDNLQIHLDNNGNLLEPILLKKNNMYELTQYHGEGIINHDDYDENYYGLLNPGYVDFWFSFVEESEPIIHYTVNYYVDGEIYETQSVVENATLEAPKNPAKEDHVFIGWYVDEELTEVFGRDTKVTEETNLYAKFSPITDGGGGGTVGLPGDDNTKMVIGSIIAVVVILLAVGIIFSPKATNSKKKSKR